MDAVVIAGGRSVEVSNCEYYTLDGMAIRWRSGGNRIPGLRDSSSAITVSNSLFLAVRPLAFAGENAGCQLSLEDNTFVSMILFTLGPRAAPTVRASKNVFVLRGLYDSRPRMGTIPTNRWTERQNLFYEPKGNAFASETVAIVPSATSRSVPLEFRQRWKPLVGQARRMTPEDFRITPADAAATPSLSWEEIREYGIQPETVGPGAKQAARER